MKIVYLAGPIDFSKDYGAEWRETATTLLEKKGHRVLDPTSVEDEELVNLRRAYAQEGNFDGISDIMNKIVDRDYDLVKKSTCILARIEQVPTCGTYFELAWGHKRNIPCYIFCDSGKKDIPTWLFGMFNHNTFSSSLEEAVSKIK